MPRGNHIEVRVGKLPGVIQDIALNGDRTVEAALNAAEIEYDDDNDIQLNGQSACLEDEVSNNDEIFVFSRIKGN